MPSKIVIICQAGLLERSPIKGGRPSPYATGVSFLLGRRYHLTHVRVCAKQNHFFQIGRKWEMHCSTYCRPTSTLFTWPSEHRLLFYDFCGNPGIFIQINNFFKLPVPVIEPLTLGLQVQRSPPTPRGTPLAAHLRAALC